MNHKIPIYSAYLSGKSRFPHDEYSLTNICIIKKTLNFEGEMILYHKPFPLHAKDYYDYDCEKTGIPSINVIKSIEHITIQVNILPTLNNEI